MIRYECRRCGAVLESSDHTAGGSDRCPDCGYVQAVPGPGTAQAGQHTDPSVDLALLAGAAESTKAKRRTLDRAQRAINLQAIEPADPLPRGKKRCPECRKLIHQRASKCPYCQSRQPYEVGHLVFAFWVLLFVVFGVALGVVLVLLTPSVPSEKEPSENAQYNNLYKDKSGVWVKAQHFPDLSVSAAELYTDYKANEVAADQRYKDRVIEVTGRVDNIGKDIMDTMYVTLDTGEMIGSIQCMFGTEHANSLAGLSKGQSVTIQGKCAGKMMNVLLQGCTLK